MSRAVRIRGDEVGKTSRARRIRGDELETERGARAKKRSLAEVHSTSPRSPGQLAVRSSHSHPEILFAIFEPDEAQSGAKQGRVRDVVESAMEESSDPPKPPPYEPYIPDELAADPAILAAFKHAEAKYEEEEENQPLNKCCGLWFQRDDQRKTALVLTSAHLTRKKDPNQWKGQWTGEYHHNAKVIVHLLDNTTTPGQLIYLQEHYEFAIYEVQVDKPVHLPTFNGRVHSGQDVFRLGRDANLDIKITHGNLAYDIPSRHERCHYMYFLRDASTLKLLHDDGGPIIDLEGKVVGLVNNQINETFVPSSILHKCLDFWRRFNCMPRLHLGMTFSPIKFLDPICIERMARKHNIDSGLIVEQVSKESHAEKIGIRKGDVIESFNGKHISTTIELESLLIDICWDHFDQEKKLNTEKDVSLKILDATKLCLRTRNLTAIVSDRGEDIVKGAYPITREEASLMILDS
uniref:PDZ domain-containing protein n=1 Tax=Hordeum vulgare subsp. vulgare TaxID=112509 RepID=A0A8I6X8G4_HORVV